MKSASSQLNKARRLQKKGEKGAALKLYRKVLEDFPNNPAARAAISAIESESEAGSASADLSRTSLELAKIEKLLMQGKAPQALALAQQIEKTASESPAFQNLFGTCLKANGRLDEAILHYQKSVDLEPQSATALNNLGVALFDAGKVDAAISSYQKSLAVNSKFIDARFNLAIALSKSSRFQEAIEQYHNALTLQPSHLPTLCNLASLYMQLGSSHKAVNLLETALPDHNGNADFLNLLAVAYRRTNRMADAEKALREALNVAPDNPYLLNNLGAILAETRRLDTAVDLYSKALDLDPDYADAFNNLGNAYRQLGDETLAQTNYQKALNISPNLPEVHLNLSQLKKWSTEDTQLSLLQELVREKGFAPGDQARFHLALANAYFGLEQTESAFNELHIGNQLRKKELDYQLDNDIILFNQLKSRFAKAEMFNSKETFALQPGPAPIFILGMPRSGTTLVEQIIGGHSKVTGGGELPFLTALISEAERKMPGLNDDAIGFIRNGYLSSLKEIDPSVPFVTDKMPLNFRWLGYIRLCLPEAKVIHVQRDAMATCWSNYRNYFSGSGNGFTYDIDDVTGYYKLYRELIAHWQRLMPGFFFNLDYDELTRLPDTKVQELMGTLGLEMEQSCLMFYKSSKPVNTASSFQVKKAIYQDSSLAWRRYESHLKPMSEKLATLLSAT